MTKINMATQLNKAFTAAVRACLKDDEGWWIRGGTVRRAPGDRGRRLPACCT